MRQWKQYFEKLLNECNEYFLEYVSRTEGPIENVTTREVQKSNAEHMRILLKRKREQSNEKKP